MRLYKTFVRLESVEDPAFDRLTPSDIKAGYSQIMMKMSEAFDPPTPTARFIYVDWLSDGAGAWIQWLDESD